MEIRTDPELPYVQLEKVKVPHLEFGTAEYATMADPQDIQAHRHEYQTILWTQSGTAHHRVDDAQIQLIPHTFCMIAQGQVHQFIGIEHDFRMIYLRFNDAFLPETTFGQRWSYRATLFNNPSSHGSTLAVPSDDVTEIETLFQLMTTEYNRANAYRQHDGLRLLLQYLLLRIERFQQLQVYGRSHVNPPNYDLYLRFITLLEQDFRTHHSVKHYADTLHLSPSKLSEITKQISGNPPKQIILHRVVLEARRLVQFTNSSIKQIAYALGYSDPYNFSRMFKKQTRSSPDEYRTKTKNDMM